MKRMLGTIALLAGLFAGSAHAAQPATYVVFRDIINDTTTCLTQLTVAQQQNAAFTAFTAESSAVMRTGSFTKMALLIRVIPVGGDTLSKVTLGIQVRSHLSDSTLAGSYADTAGTFAWGGSWSQLPNSLTADSTSQLVPFAGGAGALRQVRSELHLNMVPWLGRGAMTSNQANVGPEGMVVELIDSRGGWYWAPFTSIKITCLAGPASTLGKVRIVCHLIAGNL